MGTGGFIFFVTHDNRCYTSACMWVCLYLCVRSYSSCNNVLNDILNSFRSHSKVGNSQNRNVIMLDLERHDYTVGKPWYFWASYATGAIAARLGNA